MEKISDKAYFERPEINFSKIKNYLVSGKNYQFKEQEEVEPTDSLLFGSAVHANLLDKTALEEFLVVPQLDKRTKEGKETFLKIEKEAQETGKRLIPEKIMTEALKVVPTPIAKMAIEEEGNIYENAIFWNFNNLNLKSKIDIYNERTKTLVDLKTTSDILGFKKAVIKNHYYLQLAFYEMALASEGKEVETWKIVALENKEPYDSLVFVFEPNYRHYSKMRMEEILQKFEYDYFIGGFKGISEDKEVLLELPDFLY